MCFTVFTDALEARLKENNVFTVAKRNIDGQELMYQSVKLVNGIWCLIELTLQPATSSIQVGTSVLSRPVTMLIVLCHQS